MYVYRIIKNSFAIFSLNENKTVSLLMRMLCDCVYVPCVRACVRVGLCAWLAGVQALLSIICTILPSCIAPQQLLSGSVCLHLS